MVIGPPQWKAVSIDSAGVPQGGPFGDVRHFAAACDKVHLKVAWSRLHETFVIFSQPGPTKWVCQYLCQRNGRPVPLSPALLWVLLYLWESQSRQGVKTLLDGMAQLERDYKSRLAKERYDEMEAIRGDVMRNTAIRRGWKTRKMISVPRMVRSVRIGTG